MSVGVYEMALNFLDKIGPVIARNLVSYCGSVPAVFHESQKNLLKIPGMGELRSTFTNREEAIERAEKELSLVEKYNLSCLFYLDEEYPSRLKAYPDSPLLLYIRGNIDLDHNRMLAVVGTRTPTDYGKMKCRQIVESLRNSGVSIVSGLAYGIDTVAHKSSLDYGLPTIAVLGNGFPDIYPAQNRSVADQIVANGGTLISQVPCQAKPDRENFPMRNKTVAYMTDATLVIESRASGGSMITANFAFHNHKELFALPGRSIDPTSEGCNKLIKANMAQLITEGEDLVKSMMWDVAIKSRGIQAQLFAELNDEEQLLVEIIREEPDIHIDTLALKSSLSNSILVSTLLQLELSGLVKQTVGKRYILSY